MRIYLGIKYHSDNKNKELIEQLCAHLGAQGHTVTCVVRDLEDWGRKSFSPSELMKLSFEMIDRSDLVLIELTEKGVGIGIEAGYAYSNGIPIITIAKAGSDVSATLCGISKSVVLYEDFRQIVVRANWMNKREPF